MLLSHQRNVLLALALICTAGCVVHPERGNPAFQAEARAVQFLQREVPAWSRNNGCFSCHNNGDAARALLAAERKGHRVPQQALADTLDWVKHPERWEHNKGDPGFTDLRLANLQFAATLLAATEAGRLLAPDALKAAAQRVARDQAADGSWPIAAFNPAASPVTYGSVLATYSALRILRGAEGPEFREAAMKAEQWLSAARPNSVIEAAGLLKAATPGIGSLLYETVKVSLAFLHKSQNSDGGWGPYPDAPSETFDTAVVLLALADISPDEETKRFIQEGRAFLLRRQGEDGSWPATTRPSGGESYAQQISTTGWATLALLATRE